MIEYEVIKPFAHQGRKLVIGEFIRLPAGNRFKRLLFRGRICAAPPKHMREHQRRLRLQEA